MHILSDRLLFREGGMGDTSPVEETGVSGKAKAGCNGNVRQGTEFFVPVSLQNGQVSLKGKDKAATDCQWQICLDWQ